MSEQVEVIYDFEGQEESEISISVGEILTITNKTIGDGWWQGKNSQGVIGLFPEAYVRPYQKPVTDTTPSYTIPPSESYTNEDYINDNESTWSEEWDEPPSALPTQSEEKSNPSATIPGFEKQYGGEAHDIPQMNSVSKSGKSARVGGLQLNRFSSFFRAGGEHYLLGKADATVRKSDQILVCMDDLQQQYLWENTGERFTCTIENPTQQSKMKGLKKFVCYNVTPSNTGVTVERRYKHFDWLYQRLSEKFTMIALPKLPDKQASGRFEEDFIEARMARLKLWIGWMSNHPVISQSKLFINFISLTEQKAWKMSKRQAEKDDIVGSNFFKSITLPNVLPNLSTNPEKLLDNLKPFIKVMDDGASNLSTVSHTMATHYSNVYKRDFQNWGRAMSSLAVSFGLPEVSTAPELTQALTYTGETYVKIGEMFANQPKHDQVPLIDTLWLYRGVLEAMPDLYHIQSGALRKVKECRKLVDENKMTSSECGGVAERSDTIFACLQSEVNHFNQERSRDFAVAMRDYLKSQSSFFAKIAEELKEAESLFETYLNR